MKGKETSGNVSGKKKKIKNKKASSRVLVKRPNFIKRLIGCVFREIFFPSVVCSLFLGPLLGSGILFIFKVHVETYLLSFFFPPVWLVQ